MGVHRKLVQQAIVATTTVFSRQVCVVCLTYRSNGTVQWGRQNTSECRVYWGSMSEWRYVGMEGGYHHFLLPLPPKWKRSGPAKNPHC